MHDNMKCIITKGVRCFLYYMNNAQDCKVQFVLGMHYNTIPECLPVKGLPQYGVMMLPAYGHLSIHVPFRSHVPCERSGY